jgi:O-antigen/teichoic acid export membrane protein
MQIGLKDVLWNYAATFLHIASSLILFPFILRILPRETIGIWTIFTTIISMVNLFDFGFNPSFIRNVSYIFSGVKTLKKTGFAIEENEVVLGEIDYSLLKGLIAVMRLFYSCMAVILLIGLTTGGTYYIFIILKEYTGNHLEVYIVWIIVCLINIYSFYTMYYDSLLLGRGLIKRVKQINILGQIIYLLVAIVLIIHGFGLIAIVSAQALSVIIRRILSHQLFYTADIKKNLREVIAKPRGEIFKTIYPNAIKVGLTGFGGFLVSRSAILIGSLYLPLDVIASYGITNQVIGIIAGIAMVYFATYQPKAVQHRVEKNISAIKHLYIMGCLFLIFTYIFGGLTFLFFGNWALNIIGSKTFFLNTGFIAVALIVSLLETNHGLAVGVLLTKNEVPFFKVSLISGGLIVLLLFISFKYLHLGVWGMILVPGMVQIVYNNWKWPVEVIKELKMTRYDVFSVIKLL